MRRFVCESDRWSTDNGRVVCFDQVGRAMAGRSAVRARAVNAVACVVVVVGRRQSGCATEEVMHKDGGCRTCRGCCRKKGVK